MKIAICDDDEFYRKQILYLLTEYAKEHNNMNLSVTQFSKAEDLLERAQMVEGFDIYILDIVMPGTNGIELGVSLRESGYEGSIIYLTASSEFAVDSYKVKAFNYILKPIEKDVFFRTFSEVLAEAQSKIDSSIVVKTKDSSVLISLDSILYVQPYKHTLIYNLVNGDTVESTTLRISFAEAVSELVADKRFVQCGKALVINLHNITRVGLENVEFKDGMQVPFSKAICRELRSEWSDYWFIGEEPQ